VPQEILFNEKCLQQLFHYALSLTSNEAQAYDLLHCSLEKYLHLDKSRIEHSEPYLKRIMRNSYIDNQRRKRFEEPISDQDLEKHENTISLIQPSLEDLFISQQQVSMLLQSLNGEESELLYLWAVEEYTFDEIAKMKEVAKGTLLSKMHRLKKRLQAEKMLAQTTSRESR